MCVWDCGRGEFPFSRSDMFTVDPFFLDQDSRHLQDNHVSLRRELAAPPVSLLTLPAGISRSGFWIVSPDISRHLSYFVCSDLCRWCLLRYFSRNACTCTVYLREPVEKKSCACLLNLWYTWQYVKYQLHFILREISRSPFSTSISQYKVQPH